MSVPKNNCDESRWQSGSNPAATVPAGPSLGGGRPEVSAIRSDLLEPLVFDIRLAGF